MDRAKLKGSVEALIFASDHPVKIEKIVELLNDEFEANLGKREIRAVIGEMSGSYEVIERGFFLAEVAGGYQFRTKTEFATIIQKLKARRPPRFGRAAMEVLAIIAYRQPITRVEVEELRGVDSGGVIRSLLDKGLIRILGRKEVPGKPMIYGTTKEFLELFGLRDLSQLPTLKEFVELEDRDNVPLPLTGGGSDKGEVQV